MFTHIFDDIFKKLFENGKRELCSDDFKNLYSIFGQIFVECIELIDDGCVKRVQSASGKQIYQIEHNQNDNNCNKYICLIDVNYCNCATFNFAGLNGDILTCKHLLAAKLSDVLERYEIINVSDEEMKKLIKFM